VILRRIGLRDDAAARFARLDLVAGGAGKIRAKNSSVVGGCEQWSCDQRHGGDGSSLAFLRRVHLAESAAAWIADSIRSLAAHAIDVNPEIAAEACELPGNFHKDPVDRVLVATARLHSLTLLTADDLILRYAHVKTVSAVH
jgi:PIN domain